MNTPLIRIPFEGLYNFRDLGGYATPDGAVAFGRVFRCDGLSNLSENDRAKLAEIGIAAVVDLRTSFELDRHPNSYRDSEEVAYYNFSPLEGLFEKLGSVIQSGQTFGTDEMLQLYTYMIDNSGPVFAQALSTIARHMDRPLAYHCSEGKDRAGLTTMLLYGICGVAKQDIIANYQVSYTYIRLRYEHDPRFKGSKTIASPPELMMGILEHIDERYGGIVPYVKKIGVTDEEILAIRNGMVEKF